MDCFVVAVLGVTHWEVLAAHLFALHDCSQAMHCGMACSALLWLQGIFTPPLGVEAAHLGACSHVILLLQQHPFLGVALAEWLCDSCGAGEGATQA